MHEKLTTRQVHHNSNYSLPTYQIIVIIISLMGLSDLTGYTFFKLMYFIVHPLIALYSSGIV